MRSLFSLLGRKPVKSFIIRVSVLFAALTLTAFSALLSSGVSGASSPVPYPSALRTGRVLGFNQTGAQLASSFVRNAFNDPGNCGNPNTSGIAVSGSSVTFTSNGHDCLYLQSPHMYPTVKGYVYEEKVSVSSWIPWSAFWMYGSFWPTDGEIDIVEASPTGQNNVSYHDSTSYPQGFSTCNQNNGCDGGMLPITSPANAVSLTRGLTQGTHIIDVSFGTCGSGCGSIGIWYDGHMVATVSGPKVVDGGSSHDPFWIVDSTGGPEFGSCGNPCGTFTVDYLRIWRQG